MSVRLYRWDLVGQSDDPVPYSKGDVLAVADTYGETARDLERTSSILARLNREDGWRGEAAETFAEKADDALRDVDKAAEKYTMVKRALVSFAEDVGVAQSQTAAAAVDAENAQRQVEAHTYDPLSGVADPTNAQLDANWDRLRRLGRAEDDLALARARCVAAVAALDNAAEIAARAINQASEYYRDGRWDDIKGWARDHAEFLAGIARILEWIGVALAAIGIVLLLIVTAPAWLTALVVGLGVLAAVALLATHYLLYKSMTGGYELTGDDEVTAGDLIWDIVGLVSFGAGKGAGKIARGSADAASSVAASNAARAALARLAPQVRNALNIADPTNPLRRWAMQRFGQAIQRGSNSIPIVDDVVTSALQRLRSLDVELARIGQLRNQIPSVHLTPGVVADLERALRARGIAISLGQFDTIDKINNTLDLLDLPHVDVQAILDGSWHDLENLNWRLQRIGS
ncbi:hypothetical protein F0U44_05640 [Nocardioides humilatus]|uniref:Putative T7SS secretion signal domain-containing protein n=1 Tax=Nocardioides humilatus TaxID=2607660 RepID=A0A5B1LMI4_9ACTN|nr:hypothetical protein [Nocardioides humilatus]KAA1421753.1 hypothetical protein F0U44_05640 [Nocardioides humilatus]